MDGIAKCDAWRARVVSWFSSDACGGGAARDSVSPEMELPSESWASKDRLKPSEEALEFLETPPKGATTRDIQVAGCGVGGVR